MKNALIILFFLCCGITNGQISSYNKGLKRTTIILNDWHLNKGVESFMTKQTPVGYKQCYDELKNVLLHYNLDIMEAEVDESLIDKSVEGLRDFQNLSNSLLIEWSMIKMAWRTNDSYQVYWGCNNEINLILIQKIKK